MWRMPSTFVRPDMKKTPATPSRATSSNTDMGIWSRRSARRVYSDSGVDDRACMFWMVLLRKRAKGAGGKKGGKDGGHIAACFMRGGGRFAECRHSKERVCRRIDCDHLDGHGPARNQGGLRRPFDHLEHLERALLMRQPQADGGVIKRPDTGRRMQDKRHFWIGSRRD